MFERFTDQARRVVVLAQEEARLLKHPSIGTEHLLLGLLSEGKSAGAKALASMGVTHEKAQDALISLKGDGGSAPTLQGHIPFTPNANRVLEVALREALQLTTNYIGAEHLSLALMSEGRGTAAQLIAHLGVDPQRARELTLQAIFGEHSLLAATTDGREQASVPQEGPLLLQTKKLHSSDDVLELDAFVTPELHGVLVEAAKVAIGASENTVTLNHLLSVLIERLRN